MVSADSCLSYGREAYAVNQKVKNSEMCADEAVVCTFDCSPYLLHPDWKRLANPAFFRLVWVAYGTLVWSADIDIAPEDVGEKAVCDPVPASLPTYPDAMVPHPAPEL